MYKIYAIQFDDSRIYVGFTSDFNRRILEHKRGKTKSTKNRIIIKYIVLEECDSIKNARSREKYWKSGCGKEFIKRSLINMSP